MRNPQSGSAQLISPSRPGRARKGRTTLAAVISSPRQVLLIPTEKGDVTASLFVYQAELKVLHAAWALLDTPWTTGGSDQGRFPLSGDRLRRSRSGKSPSRKRLFTPMFDPMDDGSRNADLESFVAEMVAHRPLSGP